jgi:hypothetical protein
MNRHLVFIIGATLATVPVTALAESLQGTLNKAAACGCCEGHADYLRRNGFDIKIESVNNLDDMSKSAGVPDGFQGCHLIKLDGYVFEGHISSQIIKRVLSERPKDIVGLSIPGMPSGVPGMEAPRDKPITVYAIKNNGTTTTYAEQ